jgi:hypothetical protein
MPQRMMKVPSAGRLVALVTGLLATESAFGGLDEELLLPVSRGGVQVEPPKLEQRFFYMDSAIWIWS